METLEARGLACPGPVLLDIPIVKVGHTEDDFPIGTGPYVFQQNDNLRRQLTKGGFRLASYLNALFDAAPSK